MQQIAVKATDLVKIYRLYNSPGDRIRDVLGLLSANSGRFREHRALDGISFEIAKGEKVGIIGRNGAGKSTLLKLITRTIEPTSGSLDVSGATQALLQIGTGFHPEFTGRDNIIAYLAQLGMSGAKANRLVRDIIDFAEVEDYIDQPVKSYSTGMAARLMFSASTVIEPDVLVIDEVLGVGDAYFARKSYERIKNLCTEHNSTLLLVSHDIYSSAQICDRMIWIDKGRIRFDGGAREAINLYEASIKEQEEQRLRRKAILAGPTCGAAGTDATRLDVLVDIQPAKATLSGSLFLSDIRLVGGGAVLAELDPEHPTGPCPENRTEGAGIVGLVFEGSNWLTADEAGRTDGIVLANYGQPYQKGTVRVSVCGDPAGPELVLDIESSSDQAVAAVVYDGAGRGYEAGSLALGAGRRAPWRIPLDTAGLAPVSDLVRGNADVRHGSGAVRITAIDIIDAQGASVRTLVCGGHATFCIRYAINDTVRAADVEVMLAFFRDGVMDAMRIFKSGLDLADGPASGKIDVAVSPLRLGPGNYFVTIMLAKAGYYESASDKAFSVNPDVFDVVARGLEFKVKPGHPAYTGTVTVGDAAWQMEGDDARLRKSYTDTPKYIPPKHIDSLHAAIPLRIALDLEDTLKCDFADVYDLCHATTQEARALLPGGDCDKSTRYFSVLKGFARDDYLRLSIIRMVRVARTLRRHVKPGARVLDLGSYFGNFALMARKLGFAVDAMDSYERYAPALVRERAHLVDQGVRVIDTSGAEQPLAQRAESYAAALCLGVVEHIPHTPRELLKALHSALEPGGILIVDTPNLAYVYRREALLRGESVYPPLASQFDTELPFEGHHREFTQEELRYMLGRTGFEVIDFDVFNYSIYGASEISGDDARRFLEMEREADKREVLFAVGRKV